ncbi:MAG: undecaprenyldiphospho-muramoylpentapeptide beta-N-acetylglucosaminyltransferase [Marinilabiliaceae bacterium]|nr:undecaprenyldiphospho-muramoylpentapeptide beta-N-acetylglucosaminyltransferase [Marinilabiliaceae bacterium]
MKIIISGGGTGGHIFPAISIANAIREYDASAQILFVGALGKMEMEKVPAAGYDIVGLPVAGFHRRVTYKNLTFFFKLLSSMIKAKKVIKSFAPDVVVGVGGYASGPVLRIASNRGIPTVIQEQNSFPGVTNRILSKKVNKICVAYPKMERFFPAEKIILTGNPVRQNLKRVIKREDAVSIFGLDASKKIVLVIGGSLGARYVNNGIKKGISVFIDSDVQVIWQTGKFYYSEMKASVSDNDSRFVKVYDFIQQMDVAYSVADVVVSRAGASSISEIALLEKPAIFVPSPNVAEDHQTKNAMALVEEDAAVMIKDDDSDLIAETAISLLNDVNKLEQIKRSVVKFARPNAANDIVNEIVKLVN